MTKLVEFRIGRYRLLKEHPRCGNGGWVSIADDSHRPKQREARSAAVLEATQLLDVGCDL